MTRKENRKMTNLYTNDAFFGGKLTIKQPVKGFRSGSDAVLLAASLWGQENESFLEIGCGAGVASLCAAYRLQGAHVRGIDFDESLVKLAQENALHNQMSDRVTFQVQDIQNHLEELKPQSFDCVFSNPPYFRDSTPSLHQTRTQSRHYKDKSFLKTWVNFCLKMAKPRGYVHFIFPSSDLQVLLSLLPLGRVGGMTLFPLWSREDSLHSKRILISLRKGVSSPSIVYKGLILHTTAQEYTKEAHAILWEGKGLEK